MFKERQVTMAVELSMVSIDMVGSDAVNEDENYRHSIADNDDAENDVSHPSGNAQQRHGYCTKRWRILCLVAVSVIATIIAAVIAAVLIPRHLVNICSFPLIFLHSSAFL